MSTTFAEIVTVDSIQQHPYADRLEVAKIKGTTVVVGKGAFSAGSPAIYFPPDTLIPGQVADALGVKKFLKHARYNGVHTQCRVAACRLRGQPSYGFLAPLNQLPIGSNVSDLFGALKYEPPVRQDAGDAEPEHPLFHQYTHIEHYWRFPDAIEEGTPVRVTEKLHGTNVRLGTTPTGEGTYEIMAGSHRVRRKESAGCLYWLPLRAPCVRQLLANVSSCFDDTAIIFGEIYGQGIQDMDYGWPRSFRVFDISVNGAYLNWATVARECDLVGVEHVPVLYTGPFSHAIVEEFTNGPTTMAPPDQIKSSFKGREGIVITPLVEEYSDVLFGRLILKSVSADYLDRKGAVDHE
jgi:RNA ligase (TIGR02306 family)